MLIKILKRVEEVILEERGEKRMFEERSLKIVFLWFDEQQQICAENRKFLWFVVKIFQKFCEKGKLGKLDALCGVRSDDPDGDEGMKKSRIQKRTRKKLLFFSSYCSFLSYQTFSVKRPFSKMESSCDLPSGRISWL